ncbi:MAG: acyl-ACP--UDP-N-acetylglucosamine O-acyltransferase [Verrucomicrobiota bacterium]
MTVHSTASIDPKAELGSDVSVGPFAVIEAGAQIGNGCQIAGHAQVLASVTLGSGCLVGHGTILGGNPQDLGFDPATPSQVVVGDNTTFREHVTIHRSTQENGQTMIGSDNFFMVGTHAGHDCIIGDGNVLANQVMLAGHVHLGSHTFLGGGSGFHQFIRIGDRCMVKGNSGISKDIPPFTIVSDYNVMRNLNAVGLRRAGIPAASRANLKEAFNLIMLKGLSLEDALREADGGEWEPEAKQFLDFFRAESKKGICRR